MVFSKISIAIIIAHTKGQGFVLNPQALNLCDWMHSIQRAWTFPAAKTHLNQHNAGLSVFKIVIHPDPLGFQLVKLKIAQNLSLD